MSTDPEIVVTSLRKFVRIFEAIPDMTVNGREPIVSGQDHVDLRMIVRCACDEPVAWLGQVGGRPRGVDPTWLLACRTVADPDTPDIRTLPWQVVPRPVKMLAECPKHGKQRVKVEALLKRARNVEPGKAEPFRLGRVS